MEKTIDTISMNKYLRLNAIVKKKEETLTTVLTLPYSESEDDHLCDGHVIHIKKTNFPSCYGFNGVDIYGLYCRPSSDTFSEEDFRKGMHSIPEAEKMLYITMPEKFITKSLIQILQEDNKDYTLVKLG